ncbi:hypothetical protein FS837_004385 [Tulasnella sp. UAMH 9824]|nr:hypothetical protein FS837_004385 [Tulasnella sp. UAMH 9824]
MPLHECLPLEIFETILHFCIGFETPFLDLVTLQLVCRSWRDVIVNASFLWGTINAAEGLLALHRALQMAQDSLLNIRFMERSSKIDKAEFFNLVGDRINQWSSLVVQSRSGSNPALTALGTKKPPNLKTLHVIASHNTSLVKKTVVLFGGDPAVGLKDLRLTNLPIHLTSLQLAGLRALHLEGITSVSAEEVIEIISQSPTLEILRLARLKDAVLLTEPCTGHPDIVSQHPIQLAFLIKLHLSTLHLPFLNLLLSILVVPQLRHFDVSCIVDEQPAARFLAVGVRHLLPILYHIVVVSPAYEVILSSWGYYTIRIGELTITIKFSCGFSMDHFHETYGWLSDHMEVSLADLPLHLKLVDCDMEPSHLEWFTQQTNVTKLTLQSNPWFPPSVEQIIPLLGRPISPSVSSPSPNWLLPRLEIIVTNLVSYGGNSDIVDIIERRHLASMTPSVGLDSPLPKRFKEIRLASVEKDGRESLPNEDWISNVIRVAGGADVYWAGKKIRPANKTATAISVTTAATTPHVLKDLPLRHISDDMPLHECLPLEIFENILYLCVGFATPVRDLVTLQLVCRSWHDAIANAGFLWGTINSEEGWPAFHKALEMARDSLLEITCTARFGRSMKIDHNEFFEVARERISQWGSLVILAPRCGPALAALRTQKPPNLRKLHLIALSHMHLREEEMVIFGGEPAAGLKDFRLTGVPIHITSLQLAGLKSLHLEELPSVSAAEIITLITQSPTLEILHLALLAGAVLPTEPVTGQPNLASNHRIQLPFLTSLHLSVLPRPFLNLLLSMLIFPQLRRLTVCCEVDEQPAAQFLAVGMQHLVSLLRSIIVDSQTYKVVLSSSDYYTICIGGFSITITFSHFSMDHFQETHDWLSNHLELDLANLPLHLNLENGDPEPLYLEWFTHRTNVTKLTVNRRWSIDTAIERIIPFLGRPISPSPSAPSSYWLLPRVEIMVTNLVLRNFNPDLVDMIEKRQSASQISSIGFDGPLPKRLKEIWLSYGGRYPPGPPPMDELLSEIVGVAGGADVYWVGKKIQSE